MGAIPGPGTKLQLAGRGSSAGFASLQRVRRALGQEFESRQCLRPVVSESVTAHQAVRREWRWISDTQLHSHARYHDSGIRCGPMAAYLCSQNSDEAAAASGRDRRCGRRIITFHRHLPRGQANLDTELDPVQRRSLLLVPGGIQLDRGRERLQEVGLPAGGDRHELHCSLLDRAPFRKFLREFVPHPPGRTFLPISGHGPGASGTRHGRVAGFLDHSFLDVSTEIIPEDLTRYGLAQHLTPAPTRERYLRTCSFGWLRRTCAIPFVFWRRLEARARCVRCPASPSPRLVSHFRCSMRPFSPRQSRATANW